MSKNGLITIVFIISKWYQEITNKETLKEPKKDLAISLTMSSASKCKKVDLQ